MHSSFRLRLCILKSGFTADLKAINYGLPVSLEPPKLAIAELHS